MKIRLVGPPDIVRTWATMIEEQFGCSGDEYPTRGRGTDIRYYVDIGDRKAAAVGAWEAQAHVVATHLQAEALHETAQLMPSPRETTT